MKRLAILAVVAGVGVQLATVACTKKEEVTTGVSSERYNALVERYNGLVEEVRTMESQPKSIDTSAYISNDKYNELVEKYNQLSAKEKERYQELVDKSYATSEEARKSHVHQQVLNIAMSEFVGQVKILVKYEDLGLSDQVVKRYKNVSAASKQVIESLNNLEAQILNEMKALRANADNLYAKGDEIFADTMYADAEVMSGVRKEHLLLLDIVNQKYAAAGGKPEKEIILNKSEASLGRVSSGGGIIRQNGRSVTISQSDFVATAQQQGFSSEVANDSYKMASSNNGVVGLSCSNSDLIQVLNDLVSHMKTKMNTNSDGLELAFAIDISGSMDNNIKLVLENLQSFAGNLKNVRAAGREVKVTIGTFGAPGREKIEMPLSNNLVEFERTLKQLMQDYGRRKHSTDPGEAIYWGLEQLIDNTNFTSQNRQIIVITDEPSYALQTGDNDRITRVDGKLKAFNLYPLVVRYCD